MGPGLPPQEAGQQHPRAESCLPAHCGLLWYRGRYSADYPARCLDGIYLCPASYPDAAYLVDGFEKRRYLDPEGANADLWEQVRLALEAHDGPVLVEKVSAHLSHQAVLSGQVDLQDFVGNDYADSLAANGAREGAVNPATASVVQRSTRLATQVLQRLLETTKLSLEWEKQFGEERLLHTPKERASYGTKLSRLLRHSEHELQVSAKVLKQLPSGLQCTRCQQGPTRVGLCQWLASPCRSLDVQQSATLPGLHRAPAGMSVRVSRHDLHRSHHLLHFDSCWWCVKCGSYTTTGGRKACPKLLTRPCTGRPTRGTAGFLRRLAQGKPPKPGMQWRALPPAEAFAGLRAVPRVRLRSKQPLQLAELNVPPQQVADLLTAAADSLRELDEEVEDEDPLQLGLDLA